VLVTCTGASGIVVGTDTVAASMTGRADRQLVVVDLALPRDVEPVDSWVRPVPGVTLIDLQALGLLLEGRADTTQVVRVRELVTGEVADYLTRRMEKSVAPTVAALRARAAALVATEMDRLDQRLPELDETTRAEVGLAVHRIVEKLLHTPTMRVKEFAMEGSGDDYAAALRELFDLEPKDVANVSTPPKRAQS
jgi:glutamyl-tRNA reductase